MESLVSGRRSVAIDYVRLYTRVENITGPRDICGIERPNIKRFVPGFYHSSCFKSCIISWYLHPKRIRLFDRPIGKFPRFRPPSPRDLFRNVFRQKTPSGNSSLYHVVCERFGHRFIKIRFY